MAQTLRDWGCEYHTCHMSTNVADETDTTITRTVLALAVAQDIPFETLAKEAGLTRTTAFRRRASGGWTATEVARLALRLGHPVSDLYTGLDGRLGPKPGTRVTPGLHDGGNGVTRQYLALPTRGVTQKLTQSLNRHAPNSLLPRFAPHSIQREAA